jgi:4-amino-4-deoxy-L-arabinose transferase-like glycosyltransferase
VKRFLTTDWLANRGVTRVFHLIAAALVLTGIVLRVLILLQNRNLFIDEANVVRNIAERGFGGLLKPLAYEQYAPPVFLWALEGVSLVAGYGEVAMRSVAFVCGVAALFVFWRILLILLQPRSIWLPLGILAMAPLYIRYSAEVKQYGPDVLVCLLLTLAALRWKDPVGDRRRFFLRWAFAGSLAVWSSMPSVFVLASVGACLAGEVMVRKSYKDFALLTGIAAVWLAQFALYYVLILKSQIGSDYLQEYHQKFFLFAWPDNAAEWAHNKTRILEFVSNMGGWDSRWLRINLVFIAVSVGYLGLKNRPKLILLGGPLVLLLVAAALNQYSLIERLVLFAFPYGTLLLAVGFDRVLRIPFLPAQLLVLFYGYLVLQSFNWMQLFRERYEFQEVTKGMEWLQRKGARGPQLIVHEGTMPAYLYYTNLHPRRARYESLRGAHLAEWDTHYGELLASTPGNTAYILFTGGGDASREKHLGELPVTARRVDSFYESICWGYEVVKQ